LRKRGHAQIIVCPESSELAKRAQLAGLPVAPKVGRDTDIVHAHSGRALNAAFRQTLGTSALRIMTRHVAFTPRHAWVHGFKYTHFCDGIIAVSDAVRDVLLRAGIARDRIEVIHTGIELPIEVSLRRTRHPFTVGHLGAFTKEKGQDIAIAAAKLLPDIQFILAGDGPLRDELRSVATGNVEFPGFVENLAAFFNEIDLFVMPSRSEAWGLAALEAMAHGLPVIASDIQGLAEIVEPKCSGWLFPVGDAEALATHIREVQKDRTKLDSYGRAARERAATFTVAQMASQTEAFYKRLLSLKR
jgi:glycosyltransferase involved in cell wall biosynthesis